MTAPLSKPGDSVAVPADTRLLALDLRWNAGGQTAFADRIGVAALPLARGRLSGREQLVFTNQPLTPDGAVGLASQPGLVEIDLTAVPRAVERISIVAYVSPRPNAPRRTLDQLDELSVSVRDGLTDAALAQSVNLSASLGSVTGAAILDVLRENAGWTAIIQAHGYESGLEGAAAAAGLRL